MREVDMKLPIAVMACIFMLFAETANAQDTPFVRRAIITAVVNDVGLLETTVTEEIDVKTQAAVGNVSQYNLPVNEHFYSQTIIEAETRKADGRHIAVAADKILHSALPNATTLGIFQADVKMTSVVFPDVAPGDTVHLVYKQTEIKRNIFDGFSLFYLPSASARYEKFLVTLDAPVAIHVETGLKGFEVQADEHDGRRVTTWTLKHVPFHADEALAVAAIDRDPYLVVTSLNSWSDVGKPILDSAAPMSEATPEIIKLAAEITKGKNGHREEAEAIYDWTAKNIRYFSVFLGSGGYVPHSAETILANKYGDCKDHTTLMRALLAARGITADYVLINLGRVYQDYASPAPNWFNHVILYLPEFQRYVDPTTDWTSFDNLPLGDVDKPVLHISAAGSVMERTPPMVAETNKVAVKADVTLKPDGTTTGTSVTTATGPVAFLLRASAWQAASQGNDVVVKRLLGNAGWQGTGSIVSLEHNMHADPYSLKSTFELTNNFLDEENNRNVIPYGLRYSQFPWTPINDFNRQKLTQTFVCSAETYSQTIDFHLPDGVSITNPPKDVAIDQSLAALKTHYTMDGQTLHVERTYVSRLPGSVCTPERAKELADIADRATKEFGYRPQFAKQ